MGSYQSRIQRPRESRPWRSLLLIAALAVSAAGCSLSDGPSKGKEPPQTAERAPTPPIASASKPASSTATLRALQELIVREERGQTVLQMKFAQPVNQYRHFTLPQPSRIVLDILDPKEGTVEDETYRIDTHWVSSLRVNASENTLRIVTDISAATVPVYAISPENGGLNIIVGVLDPNATAKKNVTLVRQGKRVDVAASEFSCGSASAEIIATSPGDKQVTSQRQYSGQKVSLEFKDADIKNVFRLLGEVSGKNIVVTDDVNRKVTVRLVEVPWDQALDLIVETNGLAKEETGNVLRISTAARMAQDKKNELDVRNATKNAQLRQTSYINVNYAKVKDLVDKVKQIIKTGPDIVPDERSNTIVVRGTLQDIQDVTCMVSRLDVRTPQVLIESNLIETTPTFARALGMELQFTIPSGGRSSSALFPQAGGLGTTPTTTAEADAALSGLFPGGGAVSSNAGAEPPFASALGATFSLIRNRLGPFRNINATLSAAEQEGKIKIISRPSVVTLNNVESTIASLRVLRVALPSSTNIASGSGAAAGTAVATEQIRVGITLSVSPQVSSDGFILLNIKVKSSSLGTQSPGSVVPDELSREAISNVLVRDGETVVIGGIMKDTQQESESGIPYLKEVPVLGWLFKRIRQQKDFEELMVFITPRLTAAGSENLLSAEQLWREQMRKTKGDEESTNIIAPNRP